MLSKTGKERLDIVWFWAFLVSCAAVAVGGIIFVLNLIQKFIEAGTGSLGK